MLNKFRYDPANVDTDGIADGITGVGPWNEIAVGELVAAGAGDGLAHQLNLTSTANLSAINITIVGTDADDKPVSETRAGPNNNTVETTAYFKTVTSIAASSTLGANTMDVGWVDEFVGPTVRLDWRRNVVSRYFLDVTGTISLDVDYLIEDPDRLLKQEDGKWLVVSSSLDDETADSTAFVEIGAGYTAFRIRANSYTDTAEATLYVSQPELP